MIRALSGRHQIEPAAWLPPEVLRARDTPQRRHDFGFAAVIGEVFIIQDGDLRSARRYNWRPSFAHVDQHAAYQFVVDPETDIGRWEMSDDEAATRAINVAEHLAYERQLLYQATPEGMPVIMYASPICSGGGPVLSAGGLPGGSTQVCNFTYWFYHWTDPASYHCDEIPDP